MYRMLISDLRRLFKSRLFYMAVIGYAFIYTSAVPFIMWVVGLFTHEAPEYADTELKGQPGTAAIAIAVFVTAFVMKEFSEGSVRNKISSGTKRSDILLSSVITMVIATVIIQVVSLISILISGNLMMAGFVAAFQEILLINIYYIIAAAAIAVFDTVLMFVLAGNNISLFAGTIIAVVMKFISMMILDDLYPESGETLITGTRLAVFSFIDKYIPYMHLLGFPRFQWSAYVIGGSVLAVTSILVGMLIFEKKDLK